MSDVEPSAWDPANPWHDFFHAVGAATLSYNNLESSLHLFFERYLDLPYETTVELFQKLTNSTRIGLLKSIIETKEPDESRRDAIEHALRGFSICSENRNILCHATYHEPALDGFILMKHAADSPREIRSYRLTVAEVRTAADACSDFNGYVMRLWFYLHQERLGRQGGGEPMPWPDKPHLPSKLNPLPTPKARKGAPPRPRSSRRWLLEG